MDRSRPGQIHALLDQFGIATAPTYVDGDALTVIDGRVHRHSGGMPTDLEPRVLAGIDGALGKLESLAESVPIDRPWDTPDAIRLDGQTMADWLDSTVIDVGARAFLRAVVKSLFVRVAGEVSVLDCLFHARTAGSLAAVIGIEGGAQQDTNRGWATGRCRARGRRARRAGHPGCARTPARPRRRRGPARDGI